MRFSLACVGLASFTLLAAASDGLRGLPNGLITRTENGVHLSIYRREASLIRRRGLSASIGLGDYLDV